MFKQLTSTTGLALGMSLNLDAQHVANVLDGSVRSITIAATDLKIKAIARKLFTPALLTALLCGAMARCATAQESRSSKSYAPVATLNSSTAFSQQVTVTGIIQQVVTNPVHGTPTGLDLQLLSPAGVVDASFGPNLPTDVQRELVSGQKIQIIGTVQTRNGRSCLLVRQLTLADRQITVRNQYGFLVHASSSAGARSQRSSDANSNGGIQ